MPFIIKDKVEFKRRLKGAAKIAQKHIAKLAYKHVIKVWDSGQGYNKKGNLINWLPTDRDNPILKDTGALQDNLETIFFDNGFDFKFDVINTSTKFYPQPKKKGGSPRHPANVSAWNSDRPHIGVPKQYQAGGEKWEEMALEAILQEWREMVKDGLMEKI